MQMKKRPRPNKIMEKVLHDRPTYTGRTVLSRKLIAEHDPEYLEYFHWLHMHMLHERSLLPGKIKEICICAIDAASGYSRGLYTHFKGAISHGATKEELFAGILTAAEPGGIHVLTMSLPVLAEIFREMETGKISSLSKGVTHKIDLDGIERIYEAFEEYLESDFVLPEKYEHIIKASVLLINHKYDILDSEIESALNCGATIGEIFEGLCSSSHGWLLLQ